MRLAVAPLILYRLWWHRLLCLLRAHDWAGGACTPTLAYAWRTCRRCGREEVWSRLQMRYLARGAWVAEQEARGIGPRKGQLP